MAEKQKKFHQITEFLGICLGIYLIMLGIYYNVFPMIHRIILIVSGIAGIIIDGYCLSTWK